MGEDLRPAKPETGDDNAQPQRPSSLDDILGRPGKINDGGSDSPGKLNPFDAPGKMNPIGDTPQDKLDRKAAVESTSNAAKSGDAAQLQKTLKDAFEKMGGDPNKFEKFGKELAEQLKKEGITVKPGKASIAFHKDGSADGVEYKMDGNLDPSTGKVVGEAKGTAYDWVTKQDTNKKASDVVGQLNQKDLNGNNGKIRDSRELGKGFDEAYQKGDFSQYNKDLAASFQHAFKMGGMDAVRKLELQANDTNNGGAQTPGAGPVAILEGNKLQMVNAEALPPESSKLAALMTPDQLKQAGIVKHESFGYFKVKDAGPPPINLQAAAEAGVGVPSGKKK